MLENVKTKNGGYRAATHNLSPARRGESHLLLSQKNDKYKTQSDKGEGPCKMKGEGINCAFDASDDTWIVL